MGLATLVAVAALAEIDSGGHYRRLGAIAVANVLLVALQPVLRRMAARPRAEYRFACVLGAPPLVVCGPSTGIGGGRFRCTS